MLKRIVVGLDGSDYSRVATEFAIGLAEKSQATLVGVAVIDEPEINQGVAVPVGGAAFARKTAETRIKDAQEKTQAFMAEFRKTCANSQTIEQHIDAGHPHECLANHGHAADLMVLGLRSHFHFETQDEAGDTLKDLMRRTACPIIAVPQDAKLPEHAVIGYDGSHLSARALRGFTYTWLSQFPGMPVTLLTAGDESLPEIGEIAAHLKNHGADVSVKLASGKPSKSLLAEAEKNAPSIVVAGSKGHNRLEEIFFGSTTANLINEDKSPLFLFH